MSAWELPEELEVGGKAYRIRSDYRAVLDIMTLLGDKDLSDYERGEMALEILYEDFDGMPPSDYREACERLMWFVGGGDSPAKPPRRKLADWKQDAPLIIPAVNRVMGCEVRSVPYMHWWTFLGAYMEVGDCLFAQVVAIRNKKQKGKKLEKHEQAFYREHRSLVDFQVELTDEERDLFDAWMGGGNDGRRLD